MLRNQRGFTLIELVITLFLLGILVSVTFPTYNGVYDRFLLQNTANEIKSALYLAQQYSLDESRDYCFELFQDIFRVREQKFGGRVVYRQKIDETIKVLPGYSSDATYNCHGTSSYSKFVLGNKKGEKIYIETMLGTGRARVSKIY
ncbi:prepilin-type N-terminal cleavage/methylation domain-containing protein [Clostridium aceticum]|uniref:Prepilin-type N-terminal cleavage/methylation domain-containing protein n=1 Tax=Clostridium aceticum TaxID=84022 RepID=A0A0D8ICW4_9CLOT|nr:type II secretion system protein [Clostridium aceticum]AKL95281.1 prepilin-type N-terminal cleavage/methylation domain-containing protein [Clostridium aceticum]KJF28128.1 hypothetical protein TZ02_06185 [Clostridium aceticum]